MSSTNDDAVHSRRPRAILTKIIHNDPTHLFHLHSFYPLAFIHSTYFHSLMHALDSNFRHVTDTHLRYMGYKGHWVPTSLPASIYTYLFFMHSNHSYVGWTGFTYILYSTCISHSGWTRVNVVSVRTYINIIIRYCIYLWEARGYRRGRV